MRRPRRAGRRGREDGATAALGSDEGAGLGSDEGAGLIDTLVGFVIFLVLLLVAVQTLVHLFAVSAVTAAANDAAEAVAADGGNPAAVAAAQSTAVSRLGPFGSGHTRFDWLEVNGQRVSLRVTARSPAMVPLPASYRDISRTVTVRTERSR